MRYIGVDVGKKLCQAYLMNEQGVILDKFPFSNTFDYILRLLEDEELHH
jgi:activator of 2-hydroxyglutaryl-CoA dehydratase